MVGLTTAERRLIIQFACAWKHWGTDHKVMNFFK